MDTWNQRNKIKKIQRIQDNQIRISTWQIYSVLEHCVEHIRKHYLLVTKK